MEGTFHWKKKEARDFRAGLTRADMERREAERRAEAEREVEKLRLRRAQRERQHQARREEEERKLRATDAAAMAAWQAKEDEFMLEQARTRAVIRLREQRARPIDHLMVHLHFMECAAALDAGRHAGDNDDDEDLASGTGGVHELVIEAPLDVFARLQQPLLQELHKELIELVRVEQAPHRSEFWRDVLLVCDEQVSASSGERPPNRLDPSIVRDIDQLLSDKSAAELLDLQTSIRAKLRSGEPLDVEYWEEMLRRLVVWRSKAKLRESAQTVTAYRRARLYDAQHRAAMRAMEDLEAQLGTRAPRNARAVRPDAWDADEMEPRGMAFDALPEADRSLPCRTWPEYRSRLVVQRRRILAQPWVARQRAAPMPAARSAADAMVEQAAAQALDVQEELLGDDVALAQEALQWHAKYKPRKPRYHNRVQTGYEWNKYNQVHYDSQNPPPKVVQGYKFHLFYPDLLDPLKAPTYRLQEDPEGDGSTVLLRFSAGPPYEDIAFRIVKRDWEYSYKRGFRSSFDRGVLQLQCLYRY